MTETNCSVTVMPVKEDPWRIGFIERQEEDDYHKDLVAPGGKIEMDDGEEIEGVPYFSVEHCAERELKEETGLTVDRNQMEYFCSLTLPNGRVVISLYALVDEDKNSEKIIWLTEEEIKEEEGFAPGMKTEALLLLEDLRSP